MAAPATLSVEPPALYFPAPHDRPVQNIVSVTNTSSESFAVKVKSVAPARYFVKPKRFIINPGQTTPLTISMSKPEAPVTGGKRDVFQLECRAVPPGKVGRFEDMWDSLGAAAAHVNLLVDPTPTPPSAATVIYMEDSSAQLSEQPSVTLDASSVLNGSAVSARVSEAVAEKKEALRRAAVAKAELEAQKDVETALESQRDELIAESKDGSALPSVRLSVAIFAMLTSYTIGMLLSRGWPRVPVA